MAYIISQGELNKRGKMVDNQKVVVILLLITIILAVASVIFTLVDSPSKAEVDYSNVKTVYIGDSDDFGKIKLSVKDVSGGG